MDIEVNDNNFVSPSAAEIQERKNSIQETMQLLETSQQQQQLQQKDGDDNDRFKPLIGFYNVSHVQTSSSNKNDNPVGGLANGRERINSHNNYSAPAEHSSIY